MAEIFPLLTPLAFDPRHPFPFISNRSKNLAVVVRHNRRTKFARVKIPDVLPRFVPVPCDDGRAFAFLEDVIRLNLHDLFPEVDVVDAHLFRIIRDTEYGIQGISPATCSIGRANLKRLRSLRRRCCRWMPACGAY
jgi:polyphosphate kinase